jgi:hypothetical protein
MEQTFFKRPFVNGVIRKFRSTVSIFNMGRCYLAGKKGKTIGEKKQKRKNPFCF